MNSDERLSNLKHHCEFLANPKLNGRVPGQEGNRLARNYILSAMTGQVIAPHRPTLDALVSKIKSTYLGRSD